jgi:hypothetical protein
MAVGLTGAENVTTGRDLPASVTLAQIDEQRALGWPDFHPEHFCHRCGGRNLSWWVDSDRFNAAFGTTHPYNGFVCPGCFADAHEKATGLTTTWMLVPDPTVHFQPTHPDRWWLDAE